MRIVLLTMEYPPQKGGVANYYWGLVQALQKDWNLTMDVQIVKEGYRWYQILKNIWRQHCDYLWVGQILPIGTAALILNYYQQQKYIVSLHGMDINLALKHKSWLTKKILQRARFIIVNSHYTAQLIPKYIDQKKIIIAYPCPHITYQVDQSELLLLKDKYHLPDNYILSVGRLVERKGFQLVLQAIADLSDRYPDIFYVIVGSGPYHEYLQQIVIKLGLQKKVLFLSIADDRELAGIYQLAKFLCNPTLVKGADVEGFGIVYLEANYFQKAVIAFASGGVTEAVSDLVTGLISTPQKLINDIERLWLDQSLATELGSKGSKIVQTKFSYQRQAQQIISKLYAKD